MKALTCNWWAKPSTSSDRNILCFQRFWEQALWRVAGDNWWRKVPIFPLCVGVKLPPCSPEDHWWLLQTKTVRLSQLGASLFLAEVCKVLMKDGVAGNPAWEKESFFFFFRSQDPTGASLSRGKGYHSSTLLVWSQPPTIHPGQIVYVCLPFKPVDTCGSAGTRRATEQMKKRRRGS